MKVIQQGGVFPQKDNRIKIKLTKQVKFYKNESYNK